MGADRLKNVARLTEALRDGDYWLPAASPETLARTLMPVVESIARQRAADELESAAAEVRENHGTASLSAKRIEARAANLRNGPHA